jgi:surfeit locus 1 family protein
MKRVRTGRSLGVTLAAVVGFALTVSLGVWQLGRADQKRTLLAQQLAQVGQPAADWGDVHRAFEAGELPAWHGRAVQLRGRWVPEATVYLDNRPMQGRAGFIVVTPLMPEGGGPGLLVQRGWVPRRADDRTAVPPLRTPDGVVTVEGRLAPPPSRLFQLGPDAAGPIRQNIDIDAWGEQWRLVLMPASVQQSAPPESAADGTPLQREWTVVAVDPAKHVGYAVQWFGLAALIGVLYVWFQFVSPWRRAR